MQTSGSSQNANGSYAQMTMLANTAIAAAVEHRHRRRPDTTLVATKSITYKASRANCPCFEIACEPGWALCRSHIGVWQR